jgi:uncharacterized protein (DUF983 family)
MYASRWQTLRAGISNAWADPPILTTIVCGWFRLCPTRGKTGLFRRFLSVKAAGASRGARLGLARTGDAQHDRNDPLSGNIIVPLMRSGGRLTGLMAAIFAPLMFPVPLVLPYAVAGGTVGHMLRLNRLKSDINAP